MALFQQLGQCEGVVIGAGVGACPIGDLGDLVGFGLNDKGLTLSTTANGYTEQVFRDLITAGNLHQLLNIDSFEDDFGSYNYENIYLDTMFWSDILYWRFSDRTEFSNFVLREEYKKKYEDHLEIDKIYGDMGSIFELTELYKKSYIKYDSIYNQDGKNWYNMKLNTSNDSIQYVRLRLHYKINNKFNSKIKKTCSFSVRDGKILSRHIEDGFTIRDSMIGIGRKHFMDK